MTLIESLDRLKEEGLRDYKEDKNEFNLLRYEEALLNAYPELRRRVLAGEALQQAVFSSTLMSSHVQAGNAIFAALEAYRLSIKE